MNKFKNDVLLTFRDFSNTKEKKEMRNSITKKKKILYIYINLSNLRKERS